MKLLKEYLRQSLAHKHLGRNMIGAIALIEVNQYFSETMKGELFVRKIDEEISQRPVEGYVKFDKLFLRTTSQTLKIAIFKNKNQIITKVNQALLSAGYTTKIKEIFVK